jgi:hypothetical protein
MIPAFSGFAVSLVVLANLPTSLGFRASCRVDVDLKERVKRHVLVYGTPWYYLLSSKLSAQELPLPPGRGTRRFPLNLFADDMLRLLNPKSMARYQLDR